MIAALFSLLAFASFSNIAKIHVVFWGDRGLKFCRLGLENENDDKNKVLGLLGEKKMKRSR